MSKDSLCAGVDTGMLGSRAVMPVTKLARWLDARPRIAALLALEVGLLLALAHALSGSEALAQQAGIDFRGYMAATSDWLAGGSFYEPWQLTGPYAVRETIHGMAILYPPYSLVLFVPFAIAPAPLAAVLWWLIPLGILFAIITHHRPRPASWPVLALLGLNKWAFWLIVSGNPVMWSAAAVAAGTICAWPAPLALLKPTVAPFALVGVRHRSWWVFLALVSVAALAFAPMWHDYGVATLNGRLDGIEYLLANIPIMLLPVTASWLRRRATT